MQSLWDLRLWQRSERISSSMHVCGPLLEVFVILTHCDPVIGEDASGSLGYEEDIQTM